METIYRCTECSTEDKDHQDYTSPPLALICYKCGAGRGLKSPYEQMQQQFGMLPIKENIN